MVATIVGFVLALLAPTLGSQVSEPVLTDAGYEGAFEAWRHRYHKSYATPEEQEAHFAAFKKNYDTVKTTNSQGHSFTLELNLFADIAPEDFSLSHGSAVDRNSSIWGGLPMLGVHRHVGNGSLPDSVDWPAQGMVSAVKNQGQCGACWAFTTTGSIESAWAIATKGKQVLSLSEQQLVDCDPNEAGCGGGLPERSFQGYLTTSAMCTEGTYPYKAAKGSCAIGGCTAAVMAGGIVGFKVVTRSDVGFDLNSLMSAVAQNPTTASVAGDDKLFQLYHGGILQDSAGNVCSDKVDHSVLLVGYGKQDGLDYWLVKNSWGTTWGMSGYAKVLRGKPGSSTGECGIRTDSAYPVVDSSKSNPWLNGPPIGTILAAVIGGIAGLILLICGCRCLQKRIQRGRMQQGTGTSLSVRASSSTAARPLVTPIQPPSVQAVQPVVDPSVRKGNSRQSRLL